MNGKKYLVRQHDITDCAAACLAMICMFYKKEITITKLRDTLGTDIKGTTLLGLEDGAKKLGFIGWLMGKGISKFCSKISKVVGGKLLGNVLKSAVFQTSLGSYITSKIGVLGTALGMTSLGGMIATCWDAWDRKLDGYINI